MSGPTWTSVLASGATPEETAAAMEADPDWHFSQDAIGAISHCSVSGATAYGHGDRGQASYWTRVGLLLVEAADNEFIRVGASLGELAETLGVG